MPYPTDNQLLSLTDAPQNRSLILEDTPDKALTLKLVEMGCLSGMRIEKLRTALGRGPVLIKLYPHGSLLALRYEEAQSIRVHLA